MAVKNGMHRVYDISFEKICDVLWNQDFSQCMDA